MTGLRKYPTIISASVDWNSLIDFLGGETSIPHLGIAPSYTVYIKSSVIYAIASPESGLSDYSGSSAATVIQNAINDLTSGGKILIKVGTYRSTKALTLKKNCVLQGENAESTVLQTTTGIDAIELEPITTGEATFAICDLCIDLPQSNSGHGIFSTDLKYCRLGHIRNVRVNGVDPSHWAIYLTGVFQVEIDNVFLNTHGGGISLNQSVTDYNYGNSLLSKIHVWLMSENTVGVEFRGSATDGSGIMNLIAATRVEVGTNKANCTGISFQNAKWITIINPNIEGLDPAIDLRNGSSYITIVNPYIRKFANYGIRKRSGCHGVNVFGGYLSHGGLGGTLYADENTAFADRADPSVLYNVVLAQDGLQLGASSSLVRGAKIFRSVSNDSIAIGLNNTYGTPKIYNPTCGRRRFLPILDQMGGNWGGTFASETVYLRVTFIYDDDTESSIELGRSGPGISSMPTTAARFLADGKTIKQIKVDGKTTLSSTSVTLQFWMGIFQE